MVRRNQVILLFMLLVSSCGFSVSESIIGKARKACEVNKGLKEIIGEAGTSVITAHCFNGAYFDFDLTKE